MLASHRVATIDVRPRKPISENEEVITCDAKAIDAPDESFDCVVSLCAIEHFGLGRYGDEFDLYADRKAMAEIKRVLKPGGHLILTTNITNARPSIVFNAHRIYSHREIEELCEGLLSQEEIAFDPNKSIFIPLLSATPLPGGYTIYMACWRKP
jgi:SAM-dependent methyltransferase